MAKRKKVSKSASKTKKSPYRVETYGITFDSMTFLLFSVFVLIAALIIVSKMMGFDIF